MLKRIRLSKVFSEPTIDSEGHEALHVTVVLKNNRSSEVTGDSALDTIVSIERELSKAGEERFPIVEFVTEDELKPNADPES